MKVLFSHSYFLRFDPKQWKLAQPYAPLGTIYAAALLRSQGHGVSLFDTMFAAGADEVIPHLENFKPDVFVIWDDGFNYLTKMCLTNMREAAWRMIGHAKKKGCKVLVSDSSDHYEKYLDKGADAVLIGEGERTLLEVISSFEKGRDLHEVRGLSFRIDGKAVVNPKREVLAELDTLPHPAWDLVDVGRYRKIWMSNHGYFSMNAATTRGCPFKCNWCAKPIYGNRYNSHSAAYILDEIETLTRVHQASHIWFSDDIFGLKPKWVSDFAGLVEKRNLKFRFKIQSRVDLLLEDDTIGALARSGCDTVWVGAESGSQKILDAMDKGTTVEQIYEASRMLKKHRIKPAFFLQFGYPGETKEDIAKTIRMLSDLLPDDIGISISYPLPGTPFYERVRGELKEKTNWTDSDELALMFRNTYSPAFYKQLHRFVHKNYRKRQALAAILKLLRNPAGINALDLKRSISFFYFTPAAFIERTKLNRTR
jgi:anaerobic magnesium-protoporphyrin IX monomethyl ester cyclase